MNLFAPTLETTYETFEVSIADQVATVAFNRPTKANAMNEQAWKELEAIFLALDQTPEVRAIVLAGNGKHFCAGIDVMLLMQINQQTQGNCEGRRRERILGIVKELQAPVLAIENCRKPVLAAIQGACIGAGVDIITACDMRYATKDAKFSVREIDMGMVADLGTLQRLPRLIPDGMARELSFTGRNFSGEEALQMGLVNAVADDAAGVLAHAQSIAKEIATKSPLSIRGTKQIMNYSRDHSIAEGLDNIALWNAAMLISDDLAKAIQGYMTKSKPTFVD